VIGALVRIISMALENILNDLILKSSSHVYKTLGDRENLALPAFLVLVL
jgi:hypothetical protein